MEELLTPDEYEKTTAEIVDGARSPGHEFFGCRLGSGRSNKIRGASGYSHQIDVSLESATTTVLIECKHLKKRIGVRDVLVLAARASDILQNAQGFRVIPILVTTVGATRGANRLANYYGIEVEKIVSSREFGTRIGKLVLVGISATAHMIDCAEAQIPPR